MPLSLNQKKHSTEVFDLVVKGKKEERKERKEKNRSKKGKKRSENYRVPVTFTRSEALECYVFNDALDPLLDDGACEHCRHFLTMRCPHVDEFIEEVEDMEPDL